MISTVFLLRLKQTIRLLTQLGVLRSAIVLVILLFGLAALFQATQEPKTSLLVSLLAGAGLFSLHISRIDRQFLSISFSEDRPILLFEYFLVSIPLMVMFVYHGPWSAGLILIGFCGIVPLVNFSFRKRTFTPILIKWIPDPNFEWKAGIRKSFLPLTAVWVVGLGVSFFAGSIPVSMLLIGMMVTNFYDRFESAEILVSSEKNARVFLREKILSHVGIYVLVNLPLVLAFIVFHPQQFYIPIIELALLITLLLYTICLKYAFYVPEPDKRVGQVLIGLGFIGVIIPFFTPVVMLMTLRFYLKAKQNLDLYLHDFD